MKRTRKIKITATHRRALTLHPGLIRARCAVCGREVERLAAAQAAAVLDVNAWALAQLAADGLIHLIPTVSGSLLVCRDSLFPK